PCFSVITRSASSRMRTCLSRPGKVMSKGWASSLRVAGPPGRRSRMWRRVGSDSAEKVRSSTEYLTIWLTVALGGGVVKCAPTQGPLLRTCQAQPGKQEANHQAQEETEQDDAHLSAPPSAPSAADLGQRPATRPPGYHRGNQMG